MAICDNCGGLMKKRTSPFGYVSWHCNECENLDQMHYIALIEEVAFKGFIKPKKITRRLKK